MPKTALIFGLNSQDGLYLTLFLENLGYKVIGTLRHGSTFSNTSRNIISQRAYSIYYIDYNNYNRIEELLLQTSPSIIINLSGTSSVSESFFNPTESYRSIFHFNKILITILKSNFSLRKSRLVSVSSGEIYGDRTDLGPADETCDPTPLSPYAVAKSDLLNVCNHEREKNEVNVSTVIPFNHESPFRGSSFLIPKIVKFINNLLSGNNEAKLTLGNLDVARDWGWAPDFCRAIILVAEALEPDTFVISTGQANSIRHLIEILFQYHDLDYLDWITIDEDLIRKNEAKLTYGSYDKIHDKLGWYPQTTFQAIPSKTFMPLKDHIGEYM